MNLSPKPTKDGKLVYDSETQEIKHYHVYTSDFSNTVIKGKQSKVKCIICHRPITVSSESADKVYFNFHGILAPFCRAHKPKLIPSNVVEMIKAIKDNPETNAFILNDFQHAYISNYNNKLDKLGYHWRIHKINGVCYLIKYYRKENKKEGFDSTDFRQMLDFMANCYKAKTGYTLASTAKKINQFIIEYNNINYPKPPKPLNMIAIKKGKWVYIINNDRLGEL